MKTGKRTLWLALGALLIIYLVGSRRHTAVRPFSGTIPTCSSCTLTYGGPSVVSGTVGNISRPYNQAKVLADLGLPTEGKYTISMPDNGNLTGPLVPNPPQRPITGVLYLCVKTLQLNVCDVATGPFMIQ